MASVVVVFYPNSVERLFHRTRAQAHAVNDKYSTIPGVRGHTVQYTGTVTNKPSVENRCSTRSSTG